jgi:hypothetical protein
MIPFQNIFFDKRLTYNLTYTRNIGGYNEYGKWDGKEETGVFRAIIYSPTPQQLNFLQEGELLQGALSVIADRELKLSEGNHLSDTFMFEGHRYKLSAQTFFNADIFQYIATRLIDA